MPNYGLLAQQGRREDNAAMGGQVAHISALEAELLRLLGGADTTNPMTGLPEYYFTGQTAAYSATGPGPGVGYGAGAVTGPGQGPSAGGGEGGTPTTVNWSEMGPTTRMQAPLAPTSPSAPASPEAGKMFMNLGDAITNSLLGKLTMAGKITGMLATTLGMALTNTGGYTSAGSPGGQWVGSKPNLLPLADVIAAPLAKPAAGEQFILESDPTALEEAELQRLALLELLPEIEGFTPEVASLLQKFREQERTLGSTA